MAKKNTFIDEQVEKYASNLGAKTTNTNSNTASVSFAQNGNHANEMDDYAKYYQQQQQNQKNANTTSALSNFDYSGFYTSTDKKDNKTEDYFRDVVHSPLNEDTGWYDAQKKAQNTTTSSTPVTTTASQTVSYTPTQYTAGQQIATNGNNYGISDDVMSKLGQSFQVSQSYLDAMAQTQAQLEKLQSGRTSYTDQLQSMMDKINGRDKFSYDSASDPMFQSYLSQMMNSGRSAMQDTIGQASALTGGYGSSYATSAGNQAYNSYIQDAYNNLPEYYNMALQQYQMEGDDLYNQYNMLLNADATEYQRNTDAFNANYSMAQNQWNQDYNTWASEISNAFNLAGIQNNNYWNATNFNESQRQYDQNFLENQKQFQANMDYNNAVLQQKYDAMNQDQANWETELAYKIASGNSDSSSSNSGSSYSNSQISTWMKGALDAYNKGGQDGLDAYYDSMPSDAGSEVIGNIDAYVSQYGNLSAEDRTYTKLSNGKWKDQYGNTYEYAELPVSIRDDVKKNAKKEGSSYTRTKE